MLTDVVDDAEDNVADPMHMYYVNDGVYGSFNCILYDHVTVEASLLDVSIITLCAKLAVQCIVLGPVCVCICGFVCLFVGLLPR